MNSNATLTGSSAAPSGFIWALLTRIGKVLDIYVENLTLL